MQHTSKKKHWARTPDSHPWDWGSGLKIFYGQLFPHTQCPNLQITESTIMHNEEAWEPRQLISGALYFSSLFTILREAMCTSLLSLTTHTVYNSSCAVLYSLLPNKPVTPQSDSHLLWLHSTSPHSPHSHHTLHSHPRVAFHTHHTSTETAIKRVKSYGR